MSVLQFIHLIKIEEQDTASSAGVMIILRPMVFMEWQFDTGCWQRSPQKAPIIDTISLEVCQFSDSWWIHMHLHCATDNKFLPPVFKPFYTSVIPFYQLLAPAEAQFARCVMDLWLSSPECEVGEAQANRPLMKVCPQVWFPQGVYTCLLVELVLQAPCLYSVVHLTCWWNIWIISLSTESTPWFPIYSHTKLTDGFASYCGPPVEEVWRVWRLQAGLPPLGRVECHY